jgi:hypothetical protein
MPHVTFIHGLANKPEADTLHGSDTFVGEGQRGSTQR